MKNGLFSLDLGSIADAIVLAVILSIVAALYGVVTTSGSGGVFDVFSANWVQIGKLMVNVGFTTAVISLAQSLLSTNKGSVLGITPEVLG